MTNLSIMLILVSLGIKSSQNFELPKEIRIGKQKQNCMFYSSGRMSSLLFSGAIFDENDRLSRQAFEYAVAKINSQTMMFGSSKLVVQHIDVVDAYDSYSAYKKGSLFSV